MIKKLETYVLIVCMGLLLLFAGCGTKSSETEQTSVDITETISPTPVPTVLPSPTPIVTITPVPLLYKQIMPSGAFTKPEDYVSLYDKLYSDEQWLLSDEGIQSRIVYVSKYLNISNDEATYVLAAFYDWNFTVYDPVNFNYDNEAMWLSDWLNYMKEFDYISDEDTIQTVIDKYKSGENICLDNYKGSSIEDKIKYYEQVGYDTGDIHNDDTHSKDLDTLEDNVESNDTSLLESLTDEKKFQIAASMDEFIFDDSVRNIYNIGSYYTGNFTWVLVTGYIADMQMTGMVDGIPAYRGIITTDGLFDQYQYVFSYTGNDFSYIKGDYIAAYATIYSDASIDHYNGNGDYVNSTQSIEISITEHSPNYSTENYEMNDVEKSFYLGKTYTSDNGKTLKFSFNKVGDHQIYDINMIKYGDGHIAVLYKYLERKDSYKDASLNHDNEVILVYPYGKLYTSSDDFYFGSRIYYMN